VPALLRRLIDVLLLDLMARDSARMRIVEAPHGDVDIIAKELSSKWCRCRTFTAAPAKRVCELKTD
jgi:hypothetical protein